MTTTPETPALPGDLTDETIEQAHRPEPLPAYIDPECGACNCEHEGECPTRDVPVCKECLRIAEAASPGWAETRFDIGLVAWPCAAARVAPVTPSEPEWEHGTAEGDVLLARIMDALAYLHCKSMNPKADSPHMGYHAMSEDQREFLRERQREAADGVLRMWRAEVAPAPIPDREKLRVEASNRIADIVFDQVKRCWPDLHPVFGLRYGIADAVIAEFLALAIPPVVNKAKLAEVFDEVNAAHGWEGFTNTCICGERPAGKDMDGHRLAFVVERQREWLGEAR